MMNNLDCYQDVFKATPNVIEIVSPDEKLFSNKKYPQNIRNKDTNNDSLPEFNEDAVIVIDNDMTILQTNTIFADISGHPKQEVENKQKFTGFIHPGDRQMLIQYHLKRRENIDKAPDQYSCRIKYKDGNFHKHLLKVTIIPGTAKSIVSICNTIHHDSKKAPPYSEEQIFRLLAENATDQIFITNLKFEILYISPSVQKVSGYTQEEFKLLKPDEYLSPSSFRKAKKILEAGIQGKYDIRQPFSTEYQFIHKNGSVCWIETLVKFIINESGKPTAITGASRDITERKRSEEALRKSEENFRIITEGLKDVVIVISPELIVEYVSPSAQEVSNYSPDEVIGTHISEYFVNEDEYLTAIEILNMAFLENKPTINFEFLFKAKDKESFFVETTSKPTYKNGNVVMIQCVARDITERKKVEDDLRRRGENLSIENLNLKKSIKLSERFGNIIGNSDAMLEVYDLILKAAPTEANIIIYGESGTGKELVAKAIHDMSPRHDKPFIPVNCGAIPENIIESEFFGYKKGAFTGANSDKKGYLDFADGGSLFLDEIGEIGHNMQVKLLRAIEGGGYTPVGGGELKKPNFTIIAATNRNLLDLVNKKKMREDFFFRIHVIPIQLPPLRERKDDIPLLMEYFLSQYQKNEPIAPIPPDVKKIFMDYHWPGNVRELQNMLNRFLALKKIDFADIYGKSPSVDSKYGKVFDETMVSKGASLASMVEQFEKKIISKELTENGWNKSRVASKLKIDRKTLTSKIKKCNITT